MISFLKYSLIFLLIGTGFLIKAQSPHFEKYKVVKNKKNYDVYAMVQDSTGYIWISTSEGLFRWDGFEFKNISLPDSIESSITALNVDLQNRLWIGFENGLIFTMEKNKLIPFLPEEGLGNAAISAIFFDSDSSLWFATLGEGVYYFEGKYRKRLYNISSDDGLDDSNANAVCQVKQIIYIGTDNGLSVFDKKNKKIVHHYSMRDGLSDNIIKQIQPDKRGNLWIAGEQGGMSSFNTNSNKFTNYPWKYGDIKNFIIQSDGDIWISTQSDGVVKSNLSNPSNFIHYQQDQGIHCNRTHKVFTDFENNIWIPCKSGLSRCSDNNFEILDERENFVQNDVFSFITDQKGQFWVASSSGLFYMKKDESGKLHQTQFLKNNPPITLSFVSLFEDYQGFVWAGTYGCGVFKINPANYSYQRFTSKNGLPNDNVISISGNKNEVWFSTLGGGACKYSVSEGRIDETIDEKSGLLSNYVYSVFIDSKNRKWLALDGGGFAISENGKLQKKNFHDSLGIQTVYSFAEDKAGNIWFISPDKGLYRYNFREFTHWEKINGQFCNQFKSIVANPQGDVLLTGPEGVLLYNFENSSFENLATIQDLTGFEPIVNGTHKDQNGNVWIVGTSQVLMFAAERRADKMLQPKVSIQSIQLFFQPIENRHKFSHNENNLSFAFAGFWFQSPDKLLYRYKLENYDFNWSAEGKTSFVTYSNLPYGKYTFKVQVSVKQGVWKDSPEASYSFEIKPPFWLTWWFIVLSITLIVVIIYLIFKWRVASLEQAKLQLEEEVKKRTATIVQQKEEIEAQRDEIEAQRDFVIQQRDQISQQNKNITDSIHYAHRIQKALLPMPELLKKYSSDFFILNRPMHIVSGDFYWCAEKNDKLVVAVADCTGHGVPGAFMSILGITLLNDIVMSLSNSEPNEVLNELRERIKIALQQKGNFGEAQDGMDISLIIFDKDAGIVEYAGANNPLYIIRNKELIVLKPDKMPIGIYIEEVPFSKQVFEVHKGDSLYLFSDGYMDQIGGPKESKFKSRPFGELLVANSGVSMQIQHEILDKTMNEWKNGQPQNDDILIIGIHL